MRFTRRGFLMSGAVVAGASAGCRSMLAGEFKGPTHTDAVLKLSCQVARIPGKELSEKLARMEEWGFDGVELQRDLFGNEKKYQDALKNTKLKVSAWCGAPGCADGQLVSEVVERRGPALEKIKRSLATAGEFGAVAVIFVPAFNPQTTLDNREIRKILVDKLPELGQCAEKAGTHLVMEPLNRKEAFFLRQVADGAAIARDCQSPGIGVMGDFYHMAIEETSDLGAFISGGSRLHHVHLASRTRVLPGQDDRQFVEGFRGLKWIGYRDYCSFECRVQGDAMVEIPKSMAFLRQQWKMA